MIISPLLLIVIIIGRDQRPVRFVRGDQRGADHPLDPDALLVIPARALGHRRAGLELLENFSLEVFRQSHL